MKKPIILLYTNVYDTTVGQGKAYMKFFSQFGDVLLVTSEMDLNRMIELGDILALPGGQDLNPDRYGSKPGFMMKEVNTHYEYLDKYLLMPWIETGKPIVGICRGLQALNVACGGTLHRHISGHIQSEQEYYRFDTPNRMYTYFKNERDEYIHPIVYTNSYHHQCIHKLAPGFVIVGWSEYADRDPVKKKAEFMAKKFFVNQVDKKINLSKQEMPMVPEIIYHTERPYIAFQYHPEEYNCNLAVGLITETIEKYDTQKAAEEKEEAAAQ